MKRYVDRATRVHSVSILREGSANKDYRILVQQPGERTRGKTMSPLRPVGTVVRASIISMPGPDSYKVSLDGSQSWEFLAVRTLEESAALSELDLVSPKPCQIRWDGSGWRMVTLM
jgi:hypothetical protein